MRVSLDVSLWPPIGVSVATATLNGTTQASMNGTLPVGNSLTVEADNTSTGGTDVFALAGGISTFGFALAGAGAKGTVNIMPTVTASIGGAVGTSTKPLTGDITVRSIIDTSSNASAEGVSFSTGAAAAGSVAVDNITPQVTTDITGTGGVYTAGSIYLESLENYDASGAAVFRRTTTDLATTTSGSGGVITGAGATSTVNGAPNLDSAVAAGTTVQSGGNFIVLALSYLNTDAEANTTQIGFIGGGDAAANATSSGTIHSEVDGNVSAGSDPSDTYSNLAVAFHRAHSNAMGFLIALGAVGVTSNSTTSPTVEVTMGAGARVNASGNAYNLAIAEDNANPTAEAKGIPATTTPDGAYDKPTLSTVLASNAKLGSALSANDQTFFNMNVVPDAFLIVQLGPSAAANDHPPSITSPDTASVAAGTTAVLTVTGSDPDSDPLTYSIIGGANANLFSIDPSSGALAFQTAPSYDSKNPANNTYVVEVAVSDQHAALDVQIVTVTVTQSPLPMLVPGAQLATASGTVTLADVTAMAQVAEQVWVATGLSTAQVMALDQLVYQLAPLPDGQIIAASGETILVSPDANQLGWFVDATPTDSDEFSPTSATSFDAQTGDAAGGVDLLTALLNAQGHVLGLGNATSVDDVMDAYISEGERRLPAAGEAANAVAGSLTTTDYLTAADQANPNPMDSRGAIYNRIVADKTSSGSPFEMINVAATSAPNVNIMLGAGSVLAAGSGNVVIDIESDNIAIATGGGLTGIPAPLAAITATATVGGTINVTLAGTIQHQGDLTLQLHTVNEADATGEALAVGPIGGTGVATTASVTPTISTNVAPSSDINVTGDFTIRTISESTASAISQGIAGAAGFAVGVSLANAEVAPTVSTFIGQGAKITAGGAINVETFQNENVDGTPINRGATALAEASAGSLIGTGAGAQATADNSPNISAYVANGAILSAGTQSPITVAAMANNTATAQTQGLAIAGLLAVGATISDATANGTLKAYIDGNVAQSGSVNVQAQGADTANATSSAVAGGILAGSGAVANATVGPTVQAYADGSQLTSAGSVVIAANETPQSSANVTGIAAGGLAVGVSTSTAVASPAVTATAGGAGDAISASSLAVDASTDAADPGQFRGLPGERFGRRPHRGRRDLEHRHQQRHRGQRDRQPDESLHHRRDHRPGHRQDESTGNGDERLRGDYRRRSEHGDGWIGHPDECDRRQRRQRRAREPRLAGLTDGAIYYVVTDAAHPGLIRLAELVPGCD